MLLLVSSNKAILIFRADLVVTFAVLTAAITLGSDFGSAARPSPLTFACPTEHALKSRGIIKVARLIPKATVPERLHELSTADEIVVHCRSGVRSGQVVELMKQAGYRKVKNLVGGILRWSDDVDPTMPKY